MGPTGGSGQKETEMNAHSVPTFGSEQAAQMMAAHAAKVDQVAAELSISGISLAIFRDQIGIMNRFLGAYDVPEERIIRIALAGARQVVLAAPGVNTPRNLRADTVARAILDLVG